MKRRSSLDALSSSTLIVICLTSSPLLASSNALSEYFLMHLGLFKAFFFELSLLLGVFNNFFGLFRVNFISDNLKHGDNSSHFTCFRVIAISLALIVSSASLVALHRAGVSRFHMNARRLS